MKIRAKSSILKHHPISHGGRFSGGNQLIDVLDFSSNTSPAGMPPSVKSAIKKRVDEMEYYPDTDSLGLLSSLKKYTGLSDSHIVVGNGAIEILYNFCTAFLSKKRVLIPTPTFSEYESASKLADCKFTFFKTMNLSEDVDSFISQIPKNGCVFVCNPNNPTGTLLSKTQLGKIISAAKNKSSFVFVDECFIELVPESNQSIIKLVKKYDNLFVLRSLTKSYGLAGIRIGYGIGSKKIVDVLKKIKIPWSVNALAQEAGILALKNKLHIRKSNSIIKKESNFLKNKIAKISGFECHDSSTNFILIKTKFDSTKIQKKLLKHKILIRDCKNFRGLDNHYIRIAVKSHKDNLKLLNAMEAVA